MQRKSLIGSRIGIFGKGGAGKSTVTVFLARALQELGYSVLVLDADSTNEGLAAALGAERDPDPLLEYFGGMVFSGGIVTCPVDDPTRLIGADVCMDVLPARFSARTSEGIHLVKAGKLGVLGPGAGCDGPVAKIARDLRVSGHGLRPVELVDYKAGFEDAARGALTAVDWAVVAVDPTPAAVRMAIDMTRMVSEIRQGVPPATRHLERAHLVQLAVALFREARIRGVRSVLNRVPLAATESFLRARLDGSGAPVAAVFGDESAVAEQWLRGAPLSSDLLATAARVLARDLEAANADAAIAVHA